MTDTTKTDPKTASRVRQVVNTIGLVCTISEPILSRLDSNDTGLDDVAAKWVGYTGRVAVAVGMGQPIPLPPLAIFSDEQLDQLANQLADRMSNQKGTE